MVVEELPADYLKECDLNGQYYDLMLTYLGTIAGDLHDQANFLAYMGAAYDVGETMLKMEHQARTLYAPWLNKNSE